MADPAQAQTGSASNTGRAPRAVPRARHLLVIGATRHTGHEVTRQALAAGHTVTALARDPARLTLRHERLRVVRGDVLDPATLAPALDGCDAVVSTLGATSGVRAPTTLYSHGLRNVTAAMHAAAVTRLIAVTASPLSPDTDDTLPSRVLNKLMWTMIGEVYSDMARMEQVLRASDLDWTIVRPPKLTGRAATGRYRTALNRAVRGGYMIGRADLAGAILALLDDPRALRAAIGIAY